ncbi:MAG: AAA family ATPase [Lentisphaerae bacterium]|nr:AAA family ATPase [Lentisphaerota bacterium]
MSLRIAIAGKGGSGKTTVAALLCRGLLAAQIKPLLAVDADPNSTLAEKLGIGVEQTIGDLREELRRHPEKKPAGIAKTEWMEDLLNRSVIESTGLDLVVMGRQEGPDCYCFINHLLRQCLDKLGKVYRAVVIDNEAGLEHLSRRSNGEVEVLLVVANPTITGARTAARIMELVKSLKLAVGKSGLVLNQCDRELDESLRSKFKLSGLEIMAAIPDDPAIRAYELKEQSLLTLPGDSPAAQAIEEVLSRIIEMRRKTT